MIKIYISYKNIRNEQLDKNINYISYEKYNKSTIILKFLLYTSYETIQNPKLFSKNIKYIFCIKN